MAQKCLKFSDCLTADRIASPLKGNKFNIEVCVNNPSRNPSDTQCYFSDAYSIPRCGRVICLVPGVEYTWSGTEVFMTNQHLRGHDNIKIASGSVKRIDSDSDNGFILESGSRFIISDNIGGLYYTIFQRRYNSGNLSGALLCSPETTLNQSKLITPDTAYKYCQSIQIQNNVSISGNELVTPSEFEYFKPTASNLRVGLHYSGRSKTWTNGTQLAYYIPGDVVSGILTIKEGSGGPIPSWLSVSCGTLIRELKGNGKPTNYESISDWSGHAHVIGFDKDGTKIYEGTHGIYVDYSYNN